MKNQNFVMFHFHNTLSKVVKINKFFKSKTAFLTIYTHL